MIFEKLSDNKIKIVLSKEDIKIRNIISTDLLSDHLKVQSIVQELLIEARKKLNFITEDCDLVVESILSNNEDFIFTVTKLYDDSNNCTSQHMVLILKLKNLGDFLNFCTYVDNFTTQNLPEYLSLYLYNNEYYLYVYNSPFISKYFFNSLVEFGEIVPFSNYLIGAFQEYGKKVLDSSSFSNSIK